MTNAALAAKPSHSMGTNMTSFTWKGANLTSSLLILCVAALFWFMTPPEGLNAQTWHLFIIFISTIAAVIAKPLPMGALAIIAISFLTMTGTLELKECLSTFSSNVVWLVVMAFFLARGFSKTGLGTRIAYIFVKSLGKSTLGLSYGFVLTELFLAPFIPSNTARGAGTIYPIVSALALKQGSDPSKGTQRELGAFLIKVCFHANTVTSAMFLTAIVGNPLIAGFAQSAGVKLDWMTWAIAALIPGLLHLMVLPMAIYILYPPHIKKSPEAAIHAQEKLQEMGGLQRDEWVMLGTFGLTLLLWIFSESWNIEPTTTAILGLSLLLFSGVLEWKDVLNEKGAWETMIWFAPLLMMATFLTKFGMMDWFSHKMQGYVAGMHWSVAYAILCLVYYYSHYCFASITARITALYSAFLLTMIALGTPPMLAAMSLAVISSLAGTLTHFGTGSAPVFFGAGCVTVAEWWRLSFILSLIGLAVWFVAGGLWWKALGYW